MNRYDFMYCLKNFICFKDLNLSFSQEGEDMIVDELLNYKKHGFYVDIGAHHPIHLSNTHKFYIRGWNGVNVDAMPGSMKSFERYRKRDYNVEAGVSVESGELTIYEFDEPAVNTLDAGEAKAKEEAGYKLLGEEKVRVYSVMELFDKFIPDNVEIDILDVDIEGLDNRIVAAIDWDRYHPTIVMIEKNGDDRESAMCTNDILLKAGYRLMASTSRTAIYKG